MRPEGGCGFMESLNTSCLKNVRLFLNDDSKLQRLVLGGDLFDVCFSKKANARFELNKFFPCSTWSALPRGEFQKSPAQVRLVRQSLPSPSTGRHLADGYGGMGSRGLGLCILTTTTYHPFGRSSTTAGDV